MLGIATTIVKNEGFFDMDLVAVEALNDGTCVKAIGHTSIKGVDGVRVHSEGVQKYVRGHFSGLCINDIVVYIEASVNNVIVDPDISQMYRFVTPESVKGGMKSGRIQNFQGTYCRTTGENGGKIPDRGSDSMSIDELITKVGEVVSVRVQQGYSFELVTPSDPMYGSLAALGQRGVADLLNRVSDSIRMQTHFCFKVQGVTHKSPPCADLLAVYFAELQGDKPGFVMAQPLA